MGNVAKQLIVDVEFRDLIPPLTPEEREGLEADILRDGCLDALKVWRGEGGDVLLDGHNRREICSAHDFPYEVEPVPNIESREDAKRWIINHQRHRRNLNETQRAMLAGLLANLNIGDNQHTLQVEGGEGAQICAPYSQQDVAKQFNVSRRSVQHARKVHEKGVPELGRLVTEGKAAVSAAADVASLPAHTQRELVAAGPEAIQAAAKKLHRKKSTTEQSAAAVPPVPEVPAVPPAQPEPAVPTTPVEEPLSPDGLRSCSHCGGAGAVKKEFDLLRGNLSYVICTDEACAMQTPLRKKPEEVIAIWNRRPGV
jgi:hypothetical protein